MRGKPPKIRASRLPEPRCAYCGAPASESDHVPPKNLFATPRPHNLITVPACSSCHRPTSPDDEYFRTVFALRADLDKHPDIQREVLGAAMRGLERPASIKATRKFLAGVKSVDLHSPAGLYLGTAGAYDVDYEPIFRVVERTVRGLFFHHQDTQLSKVEYGVRVFHDSFVDFSRLDESTLENLQHMVRALAHIEQRKIGEVFQYAYWAARDDSRSSAWLLRFYGKMVFFAITAKLDPNRSVPAKANVWR